MNREIGPAAVEQEIWRLSAELEHQSDAYAVAASEAARAEVVHKVAYEKARLVHRNCKTVGERDALAMVDTEVELLARQTTEAVASAALEACRSLRARLSAVQSVGANLRAQMDLGRGAAA